MQDTDGCAQFPVHAPFSPRFVAMAAFCRRLFGSLVHQACLAYRDPIMMKKLPGPSFLETLETSWKVQVEAPTPKKIGVEQKSIEICIGPYGNLVGFLTGVISFEVIIVVLVLYFAIRAAIHASEWLCAPSATRKARRLMLRAATAKEYKALPGGLQGGEIDFESWGVQIPIKKSSKLLIIWKFM